MGLQAPSLAPGEIHPTLRDPQAQAAFTRDGIVVLPLLDATAVERIRTKILAALPADPGDFFDLFRNNPPELRKQLNELVRGELEERATEVFVDHDFWSATVLVKPPGPAGEIGLHTDWNMVDETRYRSGLIWVALSDTFPANGGLHVVPGTNRLDVPYRGHNVHFGFDEPEVRHQIDEHTVQVNVPAGHAAIWDNRLLHGSGPNTSGEWRMAAALGFKPRVAQLYHYRPTADGVPHRYRIEPEFFMDYQPFDPDETPVGPHVLDAEVLPEQTWELTADDLVRLGPAEPIFGSAPAPEEPPDAVLAPPAPTDETAADETAAEAAAAPRTWRSWFGRRAARAAAAPAPTEPPSVPLRWLDLTPGTMGDHPTLLADIFARRMDGATVRGVFTPEQCERAVRSLEQRPEERFDAMFGTMLGMSLANLAAHTGDASQRGPYYDDADAVRARYRDAFDQDPLERVADVLEPASGGLRMTSPFEDGRQYLGGNIRWMEPGGRALPAHVGNEFGQQRDGSTDHLRSVTRTLDHYSWFVVLQPPDAGGELSVYDLLYESDAPGAGTWGAEGRDDASFDQRAAKRIRPEAGQLIIFGGGWRWHRVNPIEGTRPRITLGGFAGPSIDGTEIHSWF